MSEFIYFDQDQKCIGDIFVPKSDQPLPGLLIAHTWKGKSQFEIDKASAMSNKGIVTLAIDIYGNGVLGNSAEENAAMMEPFVKDRNIFRNRLNAALNALKELAEVNENKIAIMGYCFGGMAALELARSGEKIQGAISIHGLLDQGNAETNAINPKVLALHGSLDPMVPIETLNAFKQEMHDANADWQLHEYGNAMHAFTNELADAPELGTLYNKDADKRSAKAINNFLDEVFS